MAKVCLLLLALALATAAATGPFDRSKAFAPGPYAHEALPKNLALFAVEPAESPAAVPVLPGTAQVSLAQA